MYDDSITTTGAQELLNARLAQAEASLRGTPVTTREDLLATVHSALNAVLSLGNNVTPLFPVAREGPAVAGDLNDNFRILNQDAQAIIKQLLGTENDAATLFNLFASTQNNLRQTIREAVYTSGSHRYVEEFISNTKLGVSTAAVDFNAGVVSLPLVSETFVKPDSIDFGVACVGALGEGTTDLLLDGLTETSMTWTGARLELVFNFNTIQILNRFRIDLAGYQGLVIEEFSSSPDGVIREDLLADLQPASQSLDGSSGKFSGDWIADFDPRHCKQVPLTITDRAGASIALRNIQFSSRKVSSSGQVQSQQITQPLGTVVFRAAQHTANKLTSITHQVSTDKHPLPVGGAGPDAVAGCALLVPGHPDQARFELRPGRGAGGHAGHGPQPEPGLYLAEHGGDGSGRRHHRTHPELLGDRGAGAARGDAARGHAGRVQRHRASVGRAVQRGQQPDHLHRGADGDHDPLPDLGLCARRAARPQELLQPVAVRGPVRTTLISRIQPIKSEAFVHFCFRLY